jgi:hypothetical protein
MDRYWYAFENEYPPEEVAEVMGKQLKEWLPFSEISNAKERPPNT